MKFFFVMVAIIASSNDFMTSATADHSAVEVLQDIYYTCLQDFSFSCVKPKALQWISDRSNENETKLTEELIIVKKDNPGEMEVRIIL